MIKIGNVFKTLCLGSCLSGFLLAEGSELDALKLKVAELEAQQESIAQIVESKNEMGKSNNTHVGGYGEMHYNNFSRNDNSGDTREIDFHRFVLLISHEFNDKITLHSELEVEHSITSKSDVGEVALEQAYIEFKLSDHHRIAAGLFLIPVGIMNETHEPAYFYGVERNPVEKNIIPTTWSEGGAMLSGHMTDNFSYNVALASGLNMSSPYKVRGGRQKVGEAMADDFSITGRLKWSPRPGVELSGTIQGQGDMTQGQDVAAGSGMLIETHAIYTIKDFSVKALYAVWDLSGTGPQAAGTDKQEGFYIEPAYRVNEQWGLFLRFNQYDNTAGNSSLKGEKQQTNLGFNYWPHHRVVVKLDYETQSNEDNTDSDGINLGIGFDF